MQARYAIYPKIKALAQREKAEIFFGDAAHMRSDHHAGRTGGKRAKLPSSKPRVLERYRMRTW